MSIEATTYLLQPPLALPEPKPGCAACADIAKTRAEAAAAGDYSRVSDCNIRLRRHPHHNPPISA